MAGLDGDSVYSGGRERWAAFFTTIYRLYDQAMTRINFPSYYCSQCERRIRHWVYRFEGLIYCQECADIYVAKLQELRRLRFLE